MFVSHSMKQQGFSLVEVLAAMVILAVAIIGLIGYLPVGYRNVTRAGHLSTMTHLANMKLDQLKELAYDAGDLADGFQPSSFTRSVENTGTAQFKGYAITWKVTDNNPTPKMKRIDVTVTYNYYNDDGTPIYDDDGDDLADETLIPADQLKASQSNSQSVTYTSYIAE